MAQSPERKGEDEERMRWGRDLREAIRTRLVYQDPPSTEGLRGKVARFWNREAFFEIPVGNGGLTRVEVRGKLDRGLHLIGTASVTVNNDFVFTAFANNHVDERNHHRCNGWARPEHIAQVTGLVRTPARKG